MALSRELVIELQTIIREDYEREVDFQQVSLIANDLVGYFDLLAKIQHRQYETARMNEKNSNM